MTLKIFRSRWFWIFLLICIVEEATFFFPFLSLFLLAAAIFPGISLRYAMILVDHVNRVRGTHLVIGETGNHSVPGK